MVSQAQATQARRHTESQMTSLGRVFISTGTTVDPDTLETVQTEEVHWEGLCKITFRSVVASEKSAGGQSFSDQSGMLAIPFDSVQSIRTDDTLEALGHTFRIAGVIPQTFSDALRFPIELLT